MHDINKIFESFTNAYSQHQLIEPLTSKFAPPTPKSPRLKQFIYSASAVPMLINKLKEESAQLSSTNIFFKFENLEVHTVRFVVDEDKNLWFAEEGETSAKVPAHSDLVNEAEVLSAGNLVFSEDYTTIIEINNKSGHYQPGFGSVIFAITQLLSPEFTALSSISFNETITLVNVNPHAEYRISKNDLQSFISANNLEAKTTFSDYAKIRIEAGILKPLPCKHDYLNELKRQSISTGAVMPPPPGFRTFFWEKSNPFDLAKSQILSILSTQDKAPGDNNSHKKLKPLEIAKNCMFSRHAEPSSPPINRKSSLGGARMVRFDSPSSNQDNSLQTSLLLNA